MTYKYLYITNFHVLSVADYISDNRSVYNNRFDFGQVKRIKGLNLDLRFGFDSLIQNV